MRQGPRSVGAKLAALTIGVLVASGLACPIGAQATANPTRSSTAAASTTPTTIKAQIGGVLDRQGWPPASRRALVDGFVVDVAWADLQPEPDGPIVSPNAVDAALANLRANAPSMVVKLRVNAGIEAPEWAKQLGGEPVEVVSNEDGGLAGTVGRFWTAEFGAAYNALQAKLAARYDAVPEIREVAISRCTTVHPEPFLRQWGSVTPSNLVAAGYTAALDVDCQRAQLVAHKVWRQTRSSLALNPYQRVRPNGTVAVDEALTETMMARCRTALGPRCVLSNHSIRTPMQPEPYPQMYAAINAMGGPIGYQTAVPAEIGDWQATLAWAVEQGAGYVELPWTYRDWDPVALAGFREQLKANAV